MGVTAGILSPRAYWEKLCVLHMLESSGRLHLGGQHHHSTYRGFHLPAISSLEENRAWCEGFTSVTFPTPPMSYKVATTSMLVCLIFFFSTRSDDRNQLMFQISTSLFVLKAITRKIFLGFPFWWNEPYRYILSCFIPYFSILHSAFESLELLKHNLEAWDHAYSWLLNSSLRGIINNKRHWNSMQNKTNKIFF